MKPTPGTEEATYRVFVEKLGGSPISEFVGEFGEMFYDPADASGASLRISDGTTLGGVAITAAIQTRIDEISDAITGEKLLEIKDVIDGFVDASIAEYNDLLQRIDTSDATVAAIRTDLDTNTAAISTESTRASQEETTLDGKITSLRSYVDSNMMPSNLNSLPTLS